MLLEVKNLAKSYEFKKHFYLKKESIKVFDNINLSLNLGENLLISGESGSGKTSLGKVLCMLERPSFGKVFFDGLDIFSLNFKKQRELRKDLQFIFAEQKEALNPYKTARCLIKDLARNFKLELRNLDEMMKELDFKKSLLDLKAYQLSGGELKKLALLRALLVKPKLLILDEISSSLDLNSAFLILSCLKKIQKNTDISYIFITHQVKLFKDFNAKILNMQIKGL
ncbi:ATP-binding cassette domain-containing protein [uncultured Campylobacter sp.]|uniref:ATP-binding cassette domain-containing protein n=1 Tax=uncultured Campylobacter sp. TaxID=218934 RepID=UPI0026336169|nr:ATP-binding cassette domain-containing protein [uncultured Campylobacter sp.]